MPTNRSPTTNAPQGSVRAVRRALTILKSFVTKPLQELREVSERSRLDKATARRLLLTLIAEGFVVQDAKSQAYGLGQAVRRLAGSVPDQADLRRIATPVLDQLAADLRVTAFLSVYRDHSAVCIERFHDMRGMEVRWWSVGGTLPLNCGGAPKLFLSLQDEKEIERALEQPFVALTPKSIMDKDT
ncbi:MAG: IclR family transcriptional regulator, partial [Alphaproteobacteria bacterium]